MILLLYDGKLITFFINNYIKYIFFIILSNNCFFLVILNTNKLLYISQNILNYFTYF